MSDKLMATGQHNLEEGDQLVLLSDRISLSDGMLSRERTTLDYVLAKVY